MGSPALYEPQAAHFMGESPNARPKAAQPLPISRAGRPGTPPNPVSPIGPASPMPHIPPNPLPLVADAPMAKEEGHQVVQEQNAVIAGEENGGGVEEPRPVRRVHFERADQHQEEAPQEAPNRHPQAEEAGRRRQDGGPMLPFEQFQEMYRTYQVDPNFVDKSREVKAYVAYQEIEIQKSVKPTTHVDFARRFVEQTGSKTDPRDLSNRARNYGPKMESMDPIMRMKRCFILSQSVKKDFLATLRDKADIQLEDQRRILEGSHDRSFKIGYKAPKKCSRRAEEEEEEKDNGFRMSSKTVPNKRKPEVNKKPLGQVPNNQENIPEEQERTPVHPDTPSLHTVPAGEPGNFMEAPTNEINELSLMP
ncbi:hypothetical protein CAEBREN_16890 [Caenorhabditis brenneri]|uniref:SPK domain-containing protein n=1 Tax=Caenorhabditis brenneri TaxID=135651 RepID=G0MIM6_CAEBE|nr:hypothetical protein CAEBREN_16890 [Caenorhabditis brenneri]